MRHRRSSMYWPFSPTPWPFSSTPWPFSPTPCPFSSTVYRRYPCDRGKVSLSTRLVAPSPINATPCAVKKPALPPVPPKPIIMLDLVVRIRHVTRLRRHRVRAIMKLKRAQKNGSSHGSWSRPRGGTGGDKPRLSPRGPRATLSAPSVCGGQPDWRGRDDESPGPLRSRR